MVSGIELRQMANTTTTITENYWETPDYYGNVIRGVEGFLIAMSTIFIANRIYVRSFMTQSLSYDDGIAGLAYVSPRQFMTVSDRPY